MKEIKTNEELPLDHVLSDILGEEENAGEPTALDIPAEGETDFLSERELAVLTPEERRAVYEKITGMIDGRVKAEVDRLGADYRRGIARGEDSAVREALSRSEKFGGFGENIAAIDGIIEKVPVLSTLPAKEKYTLAYLIHAGLGATEKEAPSADELVRAFRARPDAVRLFDAERAAEYSRAYEAAPPFAASRGASSMPANIRPLPKTLDEASREAYAEFGL